MINDMKLTESADNNNGRPAAVRPLIMLLALVVPILAVGLLLWPAAPAAASCGGTTNVATEAQLNAAIVAFNGGGAACDFTISFTADVTLTANLTDINNPNADSILRIEGNGRTLDGDNRQYDLIETAVASNAPLSVNDLTITGSDTEGIYTTVPLTLTNSTLSNNDQQALEIRSGGGSAYVLATTINATNSSGIQGNGPATILSSTVSNNRGNGIFIAAPFTVTNSTVSGNTNDGIDISSNGTLILTNSTVSSNGADGLSVRNNSHADVRNSILAGNAQNDCFLQGSSTADIDFTLIEDSGAAACGLAAANPDGDGNIIGEKAIIGPLQDNGGPTHTQALLNLSGDVIAASPALDAGSNALDNDPDGSQLPTDQRGAGFPRVLNGTVDMGAYEGSQSVTCSLPATVFNEDELNEAIICYNALTAPGAYVINFGSDIDLTAATQAIDNATAGVSLTIDGHDFTIDGQDIAGVRPFAVNEDSNVTIRNITITGGNSTDSGGGILNFGYLTLTHSIVSDNYAEFLGGGAANAGLLWVSFSTFEGNASSFGGGIADYNFDNLQLEADLAVSHSTFISNTAEDSGGGILLIFEGADGWISNSTFHGNSAADAGGAIANSAGVLISSNNTLVGNIANTSNGGQGGGIATGFFVCFTADMQVLLADGSTKRIADVEVGDEVLSYDFATGRQVTSVVEATLNREVDEFLRINDLEVTAEHPFAVGDDQWVRAKDLHVGDEILDSDGGWTTVNSIETVQKTAEVYNISVDGPHNYYVSDGQESYLVHNKQLGQPGESIIHNTIITDSTGNDCRSFGGTFSGGDNLIDDHAAGDCSAISTAAVSGLDPNLGDNGGPTLTHALLAGSNAIDNGNNANAVGPDGPLTTDQRGPGFDRIINGTVDIGSYEYSATTSACPVGPGVGNEVTTILGAGMGRPGRSKRVKKLIVANPGDLTALYGQMAAKNFGQVRFVRFIYPDKSYVKVKPETDLGASGAVSWWGADLDPAELQNRNWVKGRWFIRSKYKGNHLPRAMVLYPTYQTDEEYANAFLTYGWPDNFVAGAAGFAQTQTNILPIPETQAMTDITVMVAIADINVDARSIDLTIEAGGVSDMQTLVKPINKNMELLNIVEVLLEDVPAGTDDISITMDSVLNEGDSAALLGATAHYECGELGQFGSITIIKELVISDPPDSDWEFTWTSPIGPGGTTLPAAGGSFGGGGAPVGAWTFTETPKQGWDVEVQCDTGESSLNNSIAFTLDPGEDVTCTFYNALPR